MSKNLWAVLAVAYCLLGTAGSAAGQDYKVGDQVVVIERAKLAVTQNGEVDSVWPGLVLTVKDVNDKWLWLSNGKPGWLDRKYVVPLDRAAIDKLTALIRANPKDAGLYSGRADVWKHLGELEIALGDYKEAIRLNPSSAYFNNRGNLYKQLKQYDKALEDYNEALRLEPKYAIALTNRGHLWYLQDEYDKALADYNEAIRLDPNDTTAIDFRGDVWLAKGEFEKAIADYSLAIKLDARHYVAFTDRGIAKRQSGDTEGAIADYTKALEYNPGYARAFYLRAFAWETKGENAKAIADYGEASRLEPKNADYIKARGVVFTIVGEFDRAIADLDEAIRLDPKNADAYKRRGYVWYRTSELVKAVADFDAALRLDEEFVEAYYRRGDARMRLRQFVEAVADYDAALQRDPTEHWALLNRGLANMFQKKEEGVVDFHNYLTRYGWDDEFAAYAVIFGYWSARELGDDRAAQQFLDDATGKFGETWPAPALAHMRQEIDAATMLDAAVDNDQQTEARCYVGLERLYAGDRKSALQHFRWVVENGNTGFAEYTIALVKLKQLAPDSLPGKSDQ